MFFMKLKTTGKILCLVVALVMVIGLAACNKTPAPSSDSGDSKPADTQKTEDTKPAEEKPAAKEVKIKFFSNLPDRTANQGKLEQMLIDNYLKENPNVKIEIEALQDEPYQQKFKAYMASNDLPDFYMIWGSSSYFGPVMKSGYAAELNKDDYKDYGFFPGSTDGFSMDGKLYGLPRNTDFMVLYINKKLFEDNGVKIPETYQDLIEASKVFRAKGIAPNAMNGKDQWNIAILYQNLASMINGDPKLVYKTLSRETTFAGEESLAKAAEMVKSLMDVKFFQDSFTAADYGAANNLFAQEKAAMYYMGAWEMGMASNESFPESFRKNVAAIPFPVVEGGKGKATDLLAWNGGGYAVSSKSQVKDEAIKLLNYFFAPENWAKNAWQMGVTVPAQNYEKYLTGSETELQKQLTKILSSSTSLSGFPWMDSSTPGFKVATELLSQELAAGVKTPAQFIEECDKAADKAAKEGK